MLVLILHIIEHEIPASKFRHQRKFTGDGLGTSVEETNASKA